MRSDGKHGRRRSKFTAKRAAADRKGRFLVFFKHISLMDFRGFTEKESPFILYLNVNLIIVSKHTTIFSDEAVYISFKMKTFKNE